MPRIVVTTEGRDETGAAVVLQEHIASVHLDSDHSAAQLVERLGWAIVDAEEIERAGRARVA
jgi:hypothetical protein